MLLVENNQSQGGKGSLLHVITLLIIFLYQHTLLCFISYIYHSDSMLMLN